jgi:chromosome segregation ATPase
MSTCAGTRAELKRAQDQLQKAQRRANEAESKAWDATRRLQATERGAATRAARTTSDAAAWRHKHDACANKVRSLEAIKASIEHVRGATNNARRKAGAASTETQAVVTSVMAALDEAERRISGLEADKARLQREIQEADAPGRNTAVMLQAQRLVENKRVLNERVKSLNAQRQQLEERIQWLESGLGVERFVGGKRRGKTSGRT